MNSVASDFPDRLSPMLVKELRQGLRARAFVILFLAIHIVLGLFLLVISSNVTADDSGTAVSIFILAAFSIAALIIQPMRGISSITSEAKGNTIDLLVLTRLSAWRIVVGKWSAIVSQTTLILLTIIPYLILRYFLGGMNLLSELVLLFVIFATSITLTAITVGISATSSLILRNAFPFVILPIGFMVSLFSGFGSVTSSFALDTLESRITIVLLLLTLAYYCYFALSLGASLIASYAENYATKRRLIALGVTIAAATLCSFPSIVSNPESLSFIFLIIFLPIFTLSLTEFSILTPATHSRFSNYGPLRTLLTSLLTPGWPQGVFFCTLLAGIAAISFILNPNFGLDVELTTYALGILASILFPAVIQTLTKDSGPKKVTNYLLIGVASLILSSILMGIAETVSNDDLTWLFIWLPPIISLMQAEGSSSDTALLIAAALSVCIQLTILLLKAARVYRANIKSLSPTPPPIAES